MTVSARRFALSVTDADISGFEVAFGAKGAVPTTARVPRGDVVAYVRAWSARTFEFGAFRYSNVAQITEAVEAVIASS